MKSKCTLSLLGGLTLALLHQHLNAEDLVHVVKRGEMLSSIGVRYRVPQSAILRANPSIDADRLAIGQRLAIPLPGLQASAGELIYQVRPKDSLSRIASFFGTTTTELAAYNGIANPNQLKAGSSIRFRAPSTQPSPPPKSSLKARPSAPAPKPAVSQRTVPATYNVGAGETLATIATATGLSVSDLKTHNPAVTNLTPEQVIPAGTVLRVPYPPLQLKN